MLTGKTAPSIVEQEILAAIEKCRNQQLIYDGILTTRILTEQLNRNLSRSTKWSLQEVGQEMRRLGFVPAVIRISYYQVKRWENSRGWRIQGSQTKRRVGRPSREGTLWTSR